MIDKTGREIWLNRELVSLTPTEFRLLYYFAVHIAEVVPYERIVTHVWGPGSSGARHAVKLYVHQLRKNVEPDGEGPQRIVPRRGQGYLFRALSGT